MHTTDYGSGTPVLWIHGFPLSSRVFEKQLAIAGARHLMPDLPGFGRTPPASVDSIDGYARLLLAELDRAGIDRAVFAGLSMGGYILMGVARLAPQRIQGAIFIDTRETPDTAEAKKGRYETMEKVKKNGIGGVVDSMLPKMLTKSAPPALVDEAETIMSSSSAEGVTAALKAMAERPDSTPVLKMIRVPSLVIVGADDTITPPSDAARLAKALPDAQVVIIPGAAHLSNMEQPQVFNDAVSKFLQRV
jgi:3-oxoadipate enol-lactonase